MNRRGFLLGGAGSLTVLVTGGCGLMPPLPSFGGSSEADALAWVRVNSDGQVSFLLPRAELGQGIDTGLTQVVAEELQLLPSLINVSYQSTDAMARCQMTVGSQSIENYMHLTAVAAAALRETLLNRAAAKLNTDAGALSCRDGAIVSSDRVIGFGELIDEEETVLPLSDLIENLELLSDSAVTRFVGHAQPAMHVHDIVTGAELFSRDVHLPGLLYGSVPKAPQLGASLLSWQADAAQSLEGVAAVVTGPDNEVGLVAETPIALSAGLRALSCVWSPLAKQEVVQVDQPIDIDAALNADLLDHTPLDEGDVGVGAARAANSISVRYDTPMAAHAAMEPRAGVARPTEKGLEIWTGSQDPWFVRSIAARGTGLAPEHVSVHNCRVGGAFGGRLPCQATYEAAWLAMAINRPVKVQWSRAEEFRYNYVGPQFSTRIQAGVDDQGRISHWHHQMAGGPVLTSSAFFSPRLHWIANLATDPGTIRGTHAPYRIDNHRIDTADIRTPMPTGPWRGLGAAPNTYAVECAMDELAQVSGQDPLQFRMAHARHPRLLRVLERLRALIAGNEGLGIAATAYKDVTFVALAAEVDVTGGTPRVTRMWCVHDCGRVISPDRVRAQVEGNLIWGVSMAIREHFALQKGSVKTENFDSYSIATQADTPALDIELVDEGDDPSGAAEAALAPAAAAIANAVAQHAARQRSLPLT